MVADWNEVKIGEAFIVNPLRRIFRGQVTPFIPMDAISGDSRTPDRIDEREFKGSGIKFKNGDTLIARITPCLENGKTIFVKDLPDGVIAHGSTEYIVLSGKPGCTDNLFAYYLARSPDFRRYAIGHMEGTSGRQRVPSIAIEKYTFRLPPVAEQCAIVHILGTLDDKIELNRQMNEILEEMASALFKSWFVDFDPVRAKVDGRWKRGQSLPTMPAHLFDLFPSELEDSEFGLIPKGWRVSKLGDCELGIESGRRPKGGIDKSLKSGIPSVGAESIQSPIGSFDYSNVKYVTPEFSNKSKKGWIQNFDVMLYKDGGKPGQFKPRVTLYGESFPFEKAMINEHVFILRSPLLDQFYLYHLISSDMVLDQLIAKGSSKAAQPGINQEEVKDTTFVQPSINLIEAFNELAKSLVMSQLNKGKEINYLREIRDTFLPVLITGQICIKHAEKFLETYI